ncbi:hypothetical protein Q3G72_019374 [Acer saccharum]|nr:hypothetical protein Q3G72_019374 [Acer saccharum]
MTFLPFLAIGLSALSSHFIWPPIPTKPNFLSTHPDRATVADTSFVESRHHHLFVEQVLLRSDRATVADTSSDRTASSSRDTSSIFVATPATSSSNRFFLGAPGKANHVSLGLQTPLGGGACLQLTKNGGMI